MKHEIIYTEDYALTVSGEKIEKGNWMYREIEGLVVNTPDFWFDFQIPYKKVIAHRPLIDAPILEGVPLLPKFSKEEDVAELSLKTYPFGNPERNAFITGYNKTKETYKYTEEDLIKCILFGMEKGLSVGKIPETDNDWVNNYVNSLQQPKRPKYFECEMEQLPSNESFGLDYGSSSLKPKTIINSQNQTELVGEYIYE
jgi:hypothetical protein